MEIGKRIELLRKERKVTQQQLADYLSVLPQTVSRWETGGSPDISLLPKIALFFGVSIDELFGMNNFERVEELVMRYSVLRDEKSYEEADRALTLELAKADEEENDLAAVKLTGLKMHLLLQKGWQFEKESEKVCDKLLEKAKERDKTMYLAAKLQKMQFGILGPDNAKYLKKYEKEYRDNPTMETLQVYFWALVTIGQGEKALSEKDSEFVKELLENEDNNSLTVWQILFNAAAKAEDIGFFEENFKTYEELAVKLTGSDNCLDVRMHMASLFASCGKKSEADVLKDKLREEVKNIDNELVRDRYMEEIDLL